MNETVYVRFRFENYGYREGDVVEARLLKRDERGIQVHLFDNRPEDFGALITAWSDLGCFEELTEMEVIALAASGVPFL